MESIFYTINGLPVHALVVHFAVVILPIAIIGIITSIYLPKYANKFSFISLVAVVIGTFFAFVASQSGEALSKKIGLPKQHADYGDILPIAAAIFMILSIIWYLISTGRIQKQIRFLNHFTALIGVSVISLTFLTGHSGAKATWEGRIKASSGQALPESTLVDQFKSDKQLAESVIKLSISEVKKHNSRDDCWSIVSGKVYNLTSFVQQHPGGIELISSICGIDGSAAFASQHGSSAKPNNVLAGLLLGNLGAEISK